MDDGASSSGIKCGSPEEALEVVMSGKYIIFNVRPANVKFFGAVGVTEATGSSINVHWKCDAIFTTARELVEVGHSTGTGHFDE